MAYVDDLESARSTWRTAGPVTLRAEADRAEVAADDADLAFVAIALADADGIVDPCCNPLVRMQVDGPAIIQAFASADPRSTEPYPEATCTTYDGRAVGVVRPTGPGDITVTFVADGFEPASCSVRAELDAPVRLV